MSPLSIIHNPGWSARFSLTVKMVAATVFAGIIVWAAIDQIQGRRFENIFHAHLFDMLGQQATEDRMRFHQHVSAFHQSARIIAAQEKFSNYVKEQQWSPEDKIRTRYYLNRTAPWLPPISMLRTFSQPRYALLLDSKGKVREVYMSREGDLPSALLTPAPLLISQSQGQTYMTDINGLSYFITSEPFISKGGPEAMLMLASPIDDTFFNSLISVHRTGHVVALLTPGKSPRVIASSNAKEMPAGTSLDILGENYLVTSKEFFDYGSSDLLTKFASFISKKRAYELTREAISSERKGHAVFAVVIISSFALVMFWLVRRIQNITMRISDFSHTALGSKPAKTKKGDQLLILQERFHCLTEEVLDMRETVKRQAENRAQIYLDIANVMIVVIGSDQNVLLINRKGREILGYETDEIIGRNWFDNFLPGRNINEIKSVFKKLMSGEIEPVEYYENPVLTKSGHERIIAWHNTVFRDENNNITASISSGDDVTDRKVAEEKLQASLREKEVLLREIHHRVKNNMQIISSMLQLQYNQAADGRESEILKESQCRVKSMALVHEKLYRSADMSHINLKDYINDLARGLLRSYVPVAGKVALKLEVEDIQLAVDSAIPCGLIINELVTNSLKHAFPGGREGEIKITLRKIPDLITEAAGQQSGLELTVSDNGIGIPENMDYRNTGSLGMRLVNVLSQNQLQGMIELIKGEGTCFRIRFREEEYAQRV